MAKVIEQLDDALTRFAEAQPLFFVATAPSGPDGHVNVSPKGYDTFRVLDPRTVAYLDLTGSGIETVAHLRDNGRITLLFCAFTGKPQLLRLSGRGEPVLPEHPEHAELASRFPVVPGARAVIRVHLERVATSCGYSVPFLAYERERTTLREWAERKGEEGLGAYRAKVNGASIDGLPGLA